ncbi:hypothetical protein WOLCODRAFT_149286 [Wolfiporia cocos MD-104 SS10]|uniref:DNA-directed DNA polymerase n=1 Tax=Wolfiporia cocos (strain MD-104) TaxID=742152 RepID=A0A2H3JHW7_WOLCO|nr:hypothetical protein WOLCODRAFT_149286 [Wolfiporia cocos MD-104 SS10]
MTAQSSVPVPLCRPQTTLADRPANTPNFTLGSKNRSYQHQYASIYFVRLQRLRKFVQARAKQRWKDVAGDPPFVRRMLEIVKGELCYIIGTVYIDMLLKPNVLEDIARDRSIPAPPPHPKICSPDDIITLEDESGRVTLVGERLKSAQLVTGVVIAALGMETSGGEFEVIDVCFAGMAPQPGVDRSWGDVRNMKKPEDDSMDVDTVPEAPQEEWIALVSGLDVGAPSSGDAQIQMLVEYLTGEAGDASDQAGAARISRLVIAGSSLSASAMSNGNDEDDDNKDKKSSFHDGRVYNYRCNGWRYKNRRIMQQPTSERS